MESLSEFLENLGYMTFSHEGFWAVLAVVVAVVVIYQLLGAFAPKTIAPVRGFFKRHPLVWLLIPAALLIYFVYVSLGWNLWVSVSDWEAGIWKPAMWGGFDNYARQVQQRQFGRR